MDLLPYYGERPLTVTDIKIAIRSSDRKRFSEVISRLSMEILEVRDEATFTAARRAAQELKTIVNEIHDSKRSAKRPFEAVLASIEDLSKEINGPVDKELTRITGLLNGHVKKLEQEKREAERLKAEKQKLEEEAHQKKVAELQAQGKEDAVRLTELSHKLDMEVAAMTLEPVKGLVPGGRVAHPWKFKLIDAYATAKAQCLRLLRIEVDNLACQDAVRAQLEIAPDQMPTLPGIEVTRDTTVTIKAASRIS